MYTLQISTFVWLLYNCRLCGLRNYSHASNAVHSNCKFTAMVHLTSIVIQSNEVWCTHLLNNAGAYEFFLLCAPNLVYYCLLTVGVHNCINHTRIEILYSCSVSIA